VADSQEGDRSRTFFSNGLLQQYRLIGEALVTCEELGLYYRFGLPGKSSSLVRQAEFQERVCTVPVEVLEAYLEDLLNQEIPDDAIFIKRQRLLPRLNWFALGGILTSLSCGLYTASAGLPLSVSLALTILLAAPFVILWHASPGWGIARRMLFAQIVSQEIARRRGGNQLAPVQSSWTEPRQLMGAAFLEVPPQPVVVRRDDEQPRRNSAVKNLFFLPHSRDSFKS
jgi:hypothetical protein